MTDDIEKAAREAGEVMDKAAAYITAQANVIERLRLERDQLRRALYECAYCLNSLEVSPSAMTKTTADTLVQLNLGGFND